ncbi:MAG: DUF4406 domain-containing protein [Mycetocola sp.]
MSTIVYVAGPMTGLPDYNYPAFNEAAAQLTAAGYSTLNPVDSEKHNPSGVKQTWDWYMRHALRMVTNADGIALLPGWAQSEGASLEVQVARRLGLDVRPLKDWLEVPS